MGHAHRDAMGQNNMVSSARRQLGLMTDRPDCNSAWLSLLLIPFNRVGVIQCWLLINQEDRFHVGCCHTVFPPPPHTPGMVPCRTATQQADVWRNKGCVSSRKRLIPVMDTCSPEESRDNQLAADVSWHPFVKWVTRAGRAAKSYWLLKRWNIRQNHHKCLSQLFPLHLNTYVMGPRPL